MLCQIPSRSVLMHGARMALPKQRSAVYKAQFKLAGPELDQHVGPGAMKQSARLDMSRVQDFGATSKISPGSLRGLTKLSLIKPLTGPAYIFISSHFILV